MLIECPAEEKRFLFRRIFYFWQGSCIYIMKKYLHLIVPVAAVLVCSLFLFSSLDHKINDLFQRALPALKERDDVVLVNIDDSSIENVGTFPWTRDIMADAIVFLREMGAESVVFDLSYLDKSPQKVDPDYVNKELPQYVDYGFKKINESMTQVFSEYAKKSLNLSDARDQLLSVNNEVKNELDTSISYVTKDMDAYLADCLNFVGNSYLTLTILDDYDMSDVDKDYLESHIALSNVVSKGDTLTPEYSSVQPAIDSLLKKACSAGFVNADNDKDGYMRRLNLLVKYNGKYYGQLVFVPLLKHYGNPQVVVSNSYITLKDAKISDTETHDIRIPRDEYGSVIIKYPPKVYEKYNSISAWNVYRSKRLEAQFIKNLTAMQENGFFSVWDDALTPLDLYQQATYVREELYKGEDAENGITFAAYKDYRNEFFQAVKTYLTGDFEKMLLAQIEDDKETAQYISDFFTECRSEFDEIMKNRDMVASKVHGAMCIIGTCATSTTDYGLITYEEHYPNPGVHATLANMIRDEDFIDDSPWWISVLLALVFCFGYCLLAKKMSTVRQLFLGIGMLVASTLVLLLFFVVTKKYVGVIVPFSSMAVTFIAMTVLGFLTTAREKSFLRSAFSRYLSSAVINEIIKDPSKLNLGGESLEMTALFTDIRGFSTISEKLTPVQLVNLLNHYLTNMSDIILDNQGTIDKFEGDAIIAFFGAPIHMKNHAELACKTAIGIKKAEVELNKNILATGESPAPIFTRIGINTGDMVVGNMGTMNKMNYTMMGNAVNLASRLEGVNKQYNTRGIMISEHTRAQIGNSFLVRSLDRVRVVGVNTPIRLYELLEESSLAPASQVDYVARWEEALKCYEQKQYKQALEQFDALCKEDADDRVVQLYMERAKQFIATPPAADWDGVFNLTQK